MYFSRCSLCGIQYKGVNRHFQRIPQFHLNNPPIVVLSKTKPQRLFYRLRTGDVGHRNQVHTSHSSSTTCLPKRTGQCRLPEPGSHVILMLPRVLRSCKIQEAILLDCCSFFLVNGLSVVDHIAENVPEWSRVRTLIFGHTQYPFGNNVLLYLVCTACD